MNGTQGIIEVEARPMERLEDLLQRIGISMQELYTIFLNGKLLTTHNKMADYLGYQQFCEDCHNWDLCVTIKDGDRLALFGLDMATLVI
jgi:hypothetical protein